MRKKQRQIVSCQW